ncbi:MULTISPECIES: DUF1353 domain-containing protein [unclassified Nocardioides]|jgi:hypothetical protein|uniref:DUF1353 domain-containing protein n=1 Tax=unclassified Nocardioides TaxID=2615069 RepID=UPI00070398E9|nr:MULTISPECIES: DUF1353 domain-containing protein [unclassified Nocardioides]KRC46479.1 hypothetical protein ASE19_21910 [Nocardioides sp. Root79]KRC69823.1 hypothetical protein ASE20_14760 [Nocardioides sp. Root240]
MKPVEVAAEPGRFFDGGTDGPDPADRPDPASPPRIVLERVERGDVHRRTERFRLLRRVAYRDREYGVLLVPADLGGFESDLTSVPTIFTWLVPRTGRHLPPALLHDGLVHGPHEPASYLSEEGHVLDRVAADRVFRDAMRDTDTGPVRSWLVWSAVTLGTIRGGSTAWSKARHARYLATAIGTLLAITLLGVLATLDLFDVVDVLPWMGERPLLEELVGGLAAAVVVPLLLGLTWGRFAVAGCVSGIALAVLLHVTVVLALISLGYQAAEWVARRRPLAAAATAGVVLIALLALVILFIGPFR